MQYARHFAFAVPWLLFAVAGPRMMAQPSPRTAAKPPLLVTRFSQQISSVSSPESFYQQAAEGLWDVYPEGDALKASMVDFVINGDDGPEVRFAGLALIPFHDPATVRPLVERAMKTETSTETRWCLLNAASYILGVGDATHMQQEKLERESKQLAASYLRFSELAVNFGIGHIHARQLRDLLDAPESVQSEEGYNPVVWHISSALLGTLDLKDEGLLSKAITSSNHRVFQNTMLALSFAGNRDFLAGLKSKRKEEITPAMEQTAAKAALSWWQGYLAAHALGDWNDAAIGGFREAGYMIEKDRQSAQSRGEFVRALDDASPIIRYNAYRMLNEIFGTHFDLDIVFFADKYALSFMDPSGKQSANEDRMKTYWRSTLGAGPANVTAHTVTPADVAKTRPAAMTMAASSTPQEQGNLSLAEAAKRLRAKKKLQGKN